jgi:hypothetical protein
VTNYSALASSARTATAATATATTATATTATATTPSSVAAGTLPRIARRALALRLARCAGLRMFFRVEVRLGAIVLKIRAVAFFKLIIAFDQDGRRIARRLR